MSSDVKCVTNPEGTMMICKSVIGKSDAESWNKLPLGGKIFVFIFVVLIALLVLSFWFYIVDRWVDQGNMTQTQKYIMTIAVYLAIGYLSSQSQTFSVIVGLLILTVLVMLLIEWLSGRSILPQKRMLA